jgi:ATP-dependent DNA helicase RecQ
LSTYETIHPEHKYRSDFELYIAESKLEDFIMNNSDVIAVGTMHKAKGKEFDNVYLLLDKKYIIKQDPAENRLLYVAMTRAKSNLSIHYNDSYLEKIQTDQMERILDSARHPMPEEIVMQAGHRDVFLDYFIHDYRQRWVNDLQAGDQLTYKDGQCFNQKGQSILRLSKSYMEKVEQAIKGGYEPIFAKVGFVVYWRKEDEDKELEKEYKIVLPEVHFAAKTEVKR